MASLINPNPVVYECSSKERSRRAIDPNDEDSVDEIDALEVFDHLKNIRDPEHPLSLEQLKVVTETGIHVDDKKNECNVFFTPTVQHCSMATLIGLCIRVKLIRSLPSRFKIRIGVTPGSHSTEAAVNKQLNDKERIAAAMDNPNLLRTIMDCIYPHGEEEEV